MMGSCQFVAISKASWRLPVAFVQEVPLPLPPWLTKIILDSPLANSSMVAESSSTNDVRFTLEFFWSRWKAKQRLENVWWPEREQYRAANKQLCALSAIKAPNEGLGKWDEQMEKRSVLIHGNSYTALTVLWRISFVFLYSAAKQAKYPLTKTNIYAK